jgi:hypothetical protein
MSNLNKIQNLDNKKSLVDYKKEFHLENEENSIIGIERRKNSPSVINKGGEQVKLKKFWNSLQLSCVVLNTIILFAFLSLYSSTDPILGTFSCYYVLSIALCFLIPFFTKQLVTRISLIKLLQIILVLLLSISFIAMSVAFLAFNLVAEATLIYFILMTVICITLPFLLIGKKKLEDKENKFPWITQKNFIRKIKAELRGLKEKFYSKRQIRKFLIGGIFVVNLMIFPFVLGCFAQSFTTKTIPEPSIALVPQNFRREGIDFEASQFEYSDKIDGFKDITFNSMFILKFSLDVDLFSSISLQAVLTPQDVSTKVHTFSSRQYRGPLSEEEAYLEVDLHETTVPVLPGNYKLKIYAIITSLFRIYATSNVYTYNITIEKDSLSFNPQYISDPLRITRRGSIYSIEDKEALGWCNYFDTRVENSLGEPVSGTFSLFLTQREGYAQVYEKVKDYNVKEDGIISYCYFTRTHHREYMRGKIEYDGSQSLFYASATHFEDADIATGKLIHTLAYPDNPEYTYEGTDWASYNKNTFDVTNHLFYHHEFTSSELQWTKSPSYSFQTGTPDFIYLDVSDDLCTYIESPLIGYLGTVADIGTFSYRYELYNYGTPNNEIDVDLKSQLYRDGELVYEQHDYQGFYNTVGSNWQTVNIDLTNYFTEAGQKFQIKINCDFDFDPSYNDDISIRFDYATLDVFYDPVYYRSFDFQNGFNDFTSPTMGTSEALYWDSEHPLSFGNEILSYQNYPGLITNNYFSSDFRLDGSWEAYSGLFSEQGQDLTFTERDDINLGPTWQDFDGNSMAIFDLLGVNPPLNVSATFQGVIKDEFVGMGDSDNTETDIRQKYVVPKIVSNDKYIVIVFAGRYSQEDKWKLYMSYALRGDDTFSDPVRLYDPGDDAIYQLAPSITLSTTDLYVVWQQRNRDTHTDGETEWNIMYGRVSLADFTLKEIMNVTTYDVANINTTAMISPEIALIPLGNRYNSNFDLLQTECRVFISFENATWKNLTPGGRDNEDNADITKNIYVAQLNSSFLSSNFNTPIKVNDKSGSEQSKYFINSNVDLETPQILTQTCYNSTSIQENSTEININFGQTSSSRVFELLSLSIINSLGETMLFSSEEDFVKMFGTNALQFTQNKIVFPEDRLFMDLYDPRTMYYAGTDFSTGTTDYALGSFFYDNVSYIKTIKDIFYYNTYLPSYQIETMGTLVSRNNYSIVGTYGTEDLNISFSSPLPNGSYFYIKYALEEFTPPINVKAQVSTIKNEVAVMFDLFKTSSEGYIYLDLSDSNFEFQTDIVMSNETGDTDISMEADFIYTSDNDLSLIYTSNVNSSFSQLMYKLFDTSSSTFSKQLTLADPIEMSDYQYYHMKNPIITTGFNSTCFIAYETNYKESGGYQMWKINYLYLDTSTETAIGPFLIKSGESTQERNPDSYWSNGNFWVFSSNNSNSWEIEFTSCYRSDLYTFSTLAADFIPLIYNWDEYNANMSIYFTLDLGEFANDLLETEDRLRFVVSIEYDNSTEILLDTGWNAQNLDSWIQNNLGTYYPRYYFSIILPD